MYETKKMWRGTEKHEERKEENWDVYMFILVKEDN